MIKNILNKIKIILISCKDLLIKITLILFIISTTYQINCCPFSLPLILKLLSLISEKMQKGDEKANGIMLQLVFTLIVAYYEYPYDYWSNDSIQKEDIKELLKISPEDEIKSAEAFLKEINKNLSPTDKEYIHLEDFLKVLNESSQSSENNINNTENDNN